MAVEAPGPISALNPAWPLEADEVREGAAHIRVVKQTLQTQFPNLNAVTPRTPDEVNSLVGATEASPLQAQITSLLNRVNALEAIAPQIGDFKFSANGSPGPDWIPCDFSERARGDDLFAVIGTTWGPGDGSTTYNVPDGRGRGPKGVGDLDGDTGKNYPLAQKAGEDAVTLTEETVPTRTVWAGDSETVQGGTGQQVADNNTTTYGGGQAHENRSPYLACYWYIRFQVTAP